MIIDERMATFIDSFATPDSPFLEKLEKYSIETNVPIIRKPMQSLIKFLLTLKAPENILEVGTAIGFSALLMAENTPYETKITTIENYEKRIPIAKANIEGSGYKERVTLIEGDAAEVLKTLDGPYDFIFMDATKGQYLNFFPEIMRLLSPGGISSQTMLCRMVTYSNQDMPLSEETARSTRVCATIYTNLHTTMNFRPLYFP